MTFKEHVLSCVPQGGTNLRHASFRANYQESENISGVTQTRAAQRATSRYLHAGRRATSPRGRGGAPSSSTSDRGWSPDASLRSYWISMKGWWL